MSSAIAQLLPDPRLREVDRVCVAVPPTEAWSIVRTADLYDFRFVRMLFDMRLLPERLHGVLRGAHSPLVSPSATLDDIVGEGSAFRLLAERPGREWVAGAIGRFWEPTIPFVNFTTSDEFASFREPGFGKVAWSLEIHPAETGGTWIGIDLRVDATDDDAWRKFVRYWTLIGRFSHSIRRIALRTWQKQLGKPASDEVRPLSGDAFLPDAETTKTDAITIEAPPARVWPWLVQMGCRRGGWYSYDALDNGGVRSADRIIPELQRIAVGDRLPAAPKDPGGFAVLAIVPERALVLGSPSLVPDAPAQDDPGLLGGRYRMTWAFVLEPIGAVATRLLVRVRGELGPGLRNRLARAAIMPIHAIMEHEQLRNLKLRAETPASG